jgi:hypothetical protein
MDQSLVQSNKRSRDRLVASIKNLNEESLRRKVNDEWTIAATLAHVAFWDQICVARWDAFDAGGSLEDIPGKTIDLVNAGNLPAWLALPGRATVDLVTRSMEELDDRIANLFEDAVRAAAAGGFMYMLDRTQHRDEHSREIETTLNL